jgi:type IV secretion system protein VirD4
MVLFALWAVAYFAVLAVALFWLATLKVGKARRADVRLAHLVVGVLLAVVAMALILRAPLLVVPVVVLVVLGLRARRTREALVRWWDEVREAQAQRRWSHNASENLDLASGVRHRLRRSGGYVYLGSERGKWVSADPEHAVLVLGPPREGKTSSIVIPTLLAARGPVVVTSTKSDVMAHTMAVRGRLGSCWLFDPSGVTPCPPGVRRLTWSPVSACAFWDHAIPLAHDMVTTARPADDSRDGGHWSERASALLAAFLHAAALDGRRMRDVLTWTLRRDGATPHELLNAKGATTASDVLDGIANTAPAEQSGIWSTAAGVLAVYRSEAAVALTDDPTFDPAAFVNSRDTVYVVAPSHSQRVAAPMIVALLKEIAHATFTEAGRHAWAGKRLDPPVLYLLDEVANIAPLPALPSMVSEGGGQGLVIVACLQDLSQARQRWKEHAEGFLSLFGTKVLLRGLGDVVTLKAVSDLVGDHEVEAVTDSRELTFFGAQLGKRSRSYGRRREPRLPVHVIAQGQPGHALLLRTGARTYWKWIRLTPWFESHPWRDLVDTQRPSTVAEGSPHAASRTRDTAG